MLRNYEEWPGECPPQVEIAHLSAFGQILCDFQFFYAADCHFYYSTFHFRLLPRLLLTQSTFAETPSMACRSREAHQRRVYIQTTTWIDAKCSGITNNNPSPNPCHASHLRYVLPLLNAGHSLTPGPFSALSNLHTSSCRGIQSGFILATWPSHLSLLFLIMVSTVSMLAIVLIVVFLCFSQADMHKMIHGQCITKLCILCKCCNRGPSLTATQECWYDCGCCLEHSQLDGIVWLTFGTKGFCRGFWNC